MPTRLAVIERSALDFSVLDTTGRCPTLSLYDYRLGRAGKTTNYPITFGIAYHSFRETLEKLWHSLVIQGGNSLSSMQTMLWETAWAVASKDWQDPPIEHKKGYLDLGRLKKTCEESFERWCQEKGRGNIIVIATETAFQLPLPRWLCRKCWTWHAVNDEVRGQAHDCPSCGGSLTEEYFTGKFDQIIEWNRRLWVRDWKTVGRKEDYELKYNPHHQFSGYTWAAQLLSGRKIDGTIVDVVYNIKTKGPEFHPTFASRNQADLDRWLEWFEFEYANYRRYEATDLWPMRTSACGDWGGCFFRECCNSGDWAARQQWLEQKTHFSVWDPMDPERETGVVE